MSAFIDFRVVCGTDGHVTPCSLAEGEALLRRWEHEPCGPHRLQGRALYTDLWQDLDLRPLRDRLRDVIAAHGRVPLDDHDQVLDELEQAIQGGTS
jgi:hypothetical protein